MKRQDLIVQIFQSRIDRKGLDVLGHVIILILGKERIEPCVLHMSGVAGRLHHSVQTNLSLFTHEFARIFQALGIDCVGTSYDPIAGVRGGKLYSISLTSPPQ